MVKIKLIPVAFDDPVWGLDHDTLFFEWPVILCSHDLVRSTLLVSTTRLLAGESKLTTGRDVKQNLFSDKDKRVKNPITVRVN